jgi:hypothetical protein
VQGQYFSPEYKKNEFHCINCGVYAKQYWANLTAGMHYVGGGRAFIPGVSAFNAQLPDEFAVSQCAHCSGHTLWFGEKIIFPRKVTVELPNKDLGLEIQTDYNEAALVLSDSPRAAAALLRLALQKLCIQLGQKGENINDDIKELVKAGLNPAIQKALDALRITGNNAVHPGEINLDEDPTKVIKLFKLINFIAQKMITEPNEVSDFYEGLPEGAKAAVEKRDGNV